jgi:hypothetical protein
MFKSPIKLAKHKQFLISKKRKKPKTFPLSWFLAEEVRERSMHRFKSSRTCKS